MVSPPPNPPFSCARVPFCSAESALQMSEYFILICPPGPHPLSTSLSLLYYSQHWDLKYSYFKPIMVATRPFLLGLWCQLWKRRLICLTFDILPIHPLAARFQLQSFPWNQQFGIFKVCSILPQPLGRSETFTEKSNESQQRRKTWSGVGLCRWLHEIHFKACCWPKRTSPMVITIFMKMLYQFCRSWVKCALRIRLNYPCHLWVFLKSYSGWFWVWCLVGVTVEVSENLWRNLRRLVNGNRWVSFRNKQLTMHLCRQHL